MKTVKLSCIITIILFFAVRGHSETIRLQTSDIGECVAISSFLSNTKGEIFLFSRKTYKVFKFNQKGEFEKSFCRYGIGPGEIKRVLTLFHNPANDYLYLPELASGIARITIFDSDGKFQNYLDIELSQGKKGNITKLLFLDDGSFYATISERLDWVSKGKLYLTKDKLSVLYFDKTGKFIKTIYETFENDELADKPRWGGPRILFNPNILVKKTANGNICIGKSDENIFNFYDKTGGKIDALSLQLKRQKLTDEEFQAAKSELTTIFKEGSRMHWLAKRMIKLEYKPIYFNYFVLPNHFVIMDLKRDSSLGYAKESLLKFYNRETGALDTSKSVKGYVYRITRKKIYVIQYDNDGNETFRLEDLNIK